VSEHGITSNERLKPTDAVGGELGRGTRELCWVEEHMEWHGDQQVRVVVDF
jgi:hypothetical protein